MSPSRVCFGHRGVLSQNATETENGSGPDLSDPIRTQGQNGFRISSLVGFQHPEKELVSSNFQPSYYPNNRLSDLTNPIHHFLLTCLPCYEYKKGNKNHTRALELCLDLRFLVCKTKDHVHTVQRLQYFD